MPAGIYVLKVNNRDTRKRGEICSRLTIKTPKRRHWHQCDFYWMDYKTQTQAITPIKPLSAYNLWLLNSWKTLMLIISMINHVWKAIVSMLLHISQKNAYHPTFTCSKLTIETLEQGVKYVQG